ncbi:MAG: cytochrome c biogenesis protein CcsA [Flavobacteriaceae bacterium]|nr:cytochrome c biogenesis protein CcsA [Flavobacteriaceae bacterium]
MKKIFDFLYSTQLMAILFVVFATAMGVATFIENDYGTQTARVMVYNAWWFELLMLLFVINFIGNIFTYKLYRKEKWLNLATHLSFIFILVGAGITRYISYEGLISIKEGESSNVIFSEGTFLQLTINDGKEQKDPIYQKMLLSAAKKNNFSLTTDFKKQEVKIELVDYLPNVGEQIVDDIAGDEYLLFVEASQDGHRHDEKIKRGTFKDVHGTLVGFDSPDDVTINLKLVDNQLKIFSKIAGDYLKMADQSTGKLEKDIEQNLEIGAVYSVGGHNPTDAHTDHNHTNAMKFVIPKPVFRAKINYVSTAKKQDSGNADMLVFDVTTNNKTERVNLVGGQYRTPEATFIKVDNLNFSMAYGSRTYHLPFSVHLNDFQLEKYPGSESAMSYASEVTIIDQEKDKKFDFRVFMNNILDYRGFRFFQSSYNITEEYEQTVLSVNHDYWGTFITYVGYTILYICLILMVVMKNTRMSDLRKRLKDIELKKSKLLTIALLFISTTLFSQQHNHQLNDSQIDSLLTKNMVSKEHADKFGRLVVQDAGGRMKPVNTFASELLRKVSKSDTYKAYDADQVLLSLTINPYTWFEIPIIYLEKGNTKVRTILGVDEDDKYARLSDFFNEMGQYKLQTYQEEANKKNNKSKFEKDVVNIDKRVNLLYSALGGSILNILPIKDDKNNKWVTPHETQLLNYTGKDSIAAKSFNLYALSLQDAINTNNYKLSDELLDGLFTIQKKFGAKVYPKESQITYEILYNNYDVFKKLFSYYMYIGVLMLLFVIIQIFKNNKLISYLVKGSIALIILFFIMHTLGLGVRWYISGRAPWSNAYESVIFVAWATMFFGLIFGKRSSLTIASTAFLTAMILMIAHWNWMDPEIANLPPVLNSYWLMIHVSVIVASYGPFALGMILGFVSLLLMIFTTKKNKEKLDITISELTTINEMALIVGLVLLTIGNFLGGQWANESWGRYWGWDAKETWALISIMVYAFVLHMRLVPGLKGRFAFNFATVLAFGSILMTYFGVNFYLSGLHSYGSGDGVITPSFIYISIAVIAVIATFAYIKFKKFYKR